MIIVRYGEIGTKSRRSRTRIETQLIENIKKVVHAKIRREYGRVFVDSDSKADAQRIARVFGVVSTSLAEKCSSDMNTLVRRGTEYARERINSKDSFAVRARRIGDQGYRSADIAKQLGSSIVEATGARVDLDEPDITVFVEVRGSDAYLFDEVIEGAGGLPLGSQGLGVALVSGGIDSPVAAWMMMKRGMDLIALFMDPRPLVDERTINRARGAIDKLAEWRGSGVKTYIAPYGGVLIELLKSRDKSLGCVLCKRMMYSVAEAVAKMEGAKFLVTGESLGQVASQTADNLAAIDAATTLPVLRPLVGMDKEEIIALAKRIGTYDVSIQPANCCLGPPQHPATRASLARVQRAEGELDRGGFVKSIVENLQVEVRG